MNIPKFVTLTGADEQTPLSKLTTLSHKPGVEIGILYSAIRDGSERYPSWDWIQEVVPDLKNAALHICGGPARSALVNHRLNVSGFQRIQINGRIKADVLEQLCADYPDHTIITQYAAFNSESLLEVPAKNHAVLIDGSGGKGIRPEAWSVPATRKAVGFAGGLGPSTTPEEVELIRQVSRTGWWVDMESNLRDENGQFSIQKAYQCVELFQNGNSSEGA